MKTATLNMRVDPSVKEEAERVYAQFGMNLTDAVNVFLHKSIMEGGLLQRRNRAGYARGARHCCRTCRRYPLHVRGASVRGRR